MAVVLVVLLSSLGMAYLIRARISLMSALLPQLSLVALGLMVLGSTGGRTSHVWLMPYLSSLAVMIVAHHLGAASVPPKYREQPWRGFPTAGIAAAVWFAGLLTIYHFAVAGVPVFADGVERSRFDFDRSGLFGLPGRMFSLGTSFVWILATANAAARGVRWRTDRTWWVATVFLVVPAFLSGFKGRLAYVVVTVVVTYVVMTGRRIRLAEVGKKYWWIAPVLVANFVAVSTLYASTASSGTGGTALLAQRLTVIAAQPVDVVVSWNQAGHRPMLANDLQYHLHRYAGLGGGSDYTLEREVSTYLLGASPTSSAFAPPVTIGGFAELSLGFGLFGGLAAVGLLAFLVGRLENSARGGVISASVRMFAALGIYTYLIRGGLAFYIINYAAVASVLVAVAYIGAAFRKRHHPSCAAKVEFDG